MKRKLELSHDERVFLAFLPFIPLWVIWLVWYAFGGSQ
jgi:hypothetical protein